MRWRVCRSALLAGRNSSNGRVCEITCFQGLALVPKNLRDITQAATESPGPVQRQLKQLSERLQDTPREGLGTIAKDPSTELLQSRCIICGFWTMDFKKVKSHIRQAHPQEWGRVHTQVEKLCAGYSAQLVKGLTCPFCRRKVHDRRKHPEQCVVLYQVCLGWVRAQGVLPGPLASPAKQRQRQETLSIQKHLGDIVQTKPRSARDAPGKTDNRCDLGSLQTTPDDFAVRTFSNNSNCCYANAIVTALCVLRARGGNFAALSPLLLQCSDHSRTARPLNLVSTFALRNILPNWRFDGRQQDASEFYMDLTDADSGDLQAVPWQGRIAGQPDPMDTGFTPIFLPISTDCTSLRGACSSWYAQAASRGLMLAPTLLVLILGRWEHGSKNEQTLELAQDIQFPVWDEGQSSTLHTYSVEAGVYHLGPTIQAGHYRSFWYTSDRSGVWISDDNARPQLAAASDRQRIRQGSYVLFLKKQ